MRMKRKEARELRQRFLSEDYGQLSPEVNRLCGEFFYRLERTPVEVILRKMEEAAKRPGPVSAVQQRMDVLHMDAQEYREKYATFCDNFSSLSVEDQLFYEPLLPDNWGAGANEVVPKEVLEKWKQS